MIDDIEDQLFPFVRRSTRRQQPPDLHVYLGARCFRNQRISCFLNTVVDELVSAIQLFDQSLTYAFPESRVHLLLLSFKNRRESGDLGDISETCHLLQCRLRLGWQADELRDHEVRHVVRVSFGVNAIEIPGPASSIMIKGEHFLFGQRRNELNCKERVAVRLLLHQLRERRAAFWLAAKRIRKQLLKMLPSERTKGDLLYLSAGALECIELAHQRMSGINFVVAKSADQHKVL